MVRGVESVLCGRPVTLVLAGRVYFLLTEKYGNIADLTERVRAETADSVELTFDVARLLAEQGELIRRKLGYEPRELPTQDEIEETALTVDPLTLVKLKKDVNAAIYVGMSREFLPEKIDLALVELEKKTGEG